MLNSLVAAAFKSLDWYTELATETLFDFTKEANLMTEIKDILDELNIISCVRRQQEAVIRPFMHDMLNQPLDTQDKSFYDSGRMESEIEELQKTARSTHAAVSDASYSIEQRLTSIVATSVGPKAEADQCDRGTSCSKRRQILRRTSRNLLITYNRDCEARMVYHDLHSSHNNFRRF